MFVPYSIYPMNSAPKIRAYSMSQSLRKLAEVTMVTAPLAESPVARSFMFESNQQLCSRLITSGRLIGELIQIIKRNEIDCVYVEALAASLFAFDYIFLEKFKKNDIPIFPFIRDMYWKYDGMFRKTSQNRKWLMRCSKEFDWYTRNASALLFPSKIMADSVDYPEKYVLPPAGDPSRCLAPELPYNKNIVFSGGISPKYGIDTLMRSMALLGERFFDARCSVIGQDDKETICEWKDSRCATFIPDKTYNEMPQLLANAYMTTIPIPKIPHNDFAMPLKLFDYMSAGRPVIATDCTAQAEFIKRNQIGIVTEDDPKSFAEGMATLIEDRDLAMKCGQNGLQSIISRHSWQHRAGELVEIMSKHC